MDYGRSSESNAITITPDPNSQETWMASLADHALWATEDDYRAWTARDPSPDPAGPGHDPRSRAGSEQPPGKRPRGSPGDAAGGGSSGKSRAIGRMFFKTKLCCKFRAGTCPYITNCNFAHGIEELRKPPPNWQEIVAAQEAEGPEPREEHQIPILSSSAMPGDGQRSYKGRHCKKFYTDEGCPYGDMCTFLHDEQSKARESVTISLGPTLGSGGYGNAAAAAAAGAAAQKPSNWKTRICNKWEMTGYCPFGSKCHFAHGSTELHRYGGGLVDGEGRDSSSAAPDQKQMGSAMLKGASDNLIAAGASIPHTDIYHIGAPLQRSVGNQRQNQRPLQRWKGPDKISRIYGDWINDDE